MQRPKLDVVPFSPGEDETPSLSSNNENEWIPVSSCSVPMITPDLFEVALTQLVHHPEYNSTLILRSDILHETSDQSEMPDCVPDLESMVRMHNIHRTLLPRRPGRDPPISQHCTFYGSAEDANSAVNCLVLTPVVEQGCQLPYYHPAVHHIAFRYIERSSTCTSAAEEGLSHPRIRIELVPTSDAPDPADITSRLYRTCLALLETLHRYCWGALTNYKKRVLHDCLVSREEYQDLYLILREKYKHLVDQWQEATDPLKHVFEDIGIATYLMLLWKQGIFSDASCSNTSPPANNESSVDEKDTSEAPWRSWRRPQAGFLDFGCGNGLLVHVLVSEGYDGHGIDVRARTSWAHYPPATRAHLHVHAFDPLSFAITDPEPLPLQENQAAREPLQEQDHDERGLQPLRFLRRGTFIIANHADELTPWTPVLAALVDASGYLSIPCCTWTFDNKFVKPRLREYNAIFAASGTSESGSLDDEKFIESMNLGGDAGSASSSYSAYRIWLAKLSRHCGWKVECENLRIPSTRNWAIVGREKIKGGEGDKDGRENARAILEWVRERGTFKTRKPEGNAKNH